MAIDLVIVTQGTELQLSDKTCARCERHARRDPLQKGEEDVGDAEDEDEEDKQAPHVPLTLSSVDSLNSVDPLSRVDLN